MAGVDELERTSEPLPGRDMKQRQSGIEVEVIGWTQVSGFEQQNDFWDHVWHAIRGATDEIRVRQANRAVPAADPDVAVVWLAKEVELVGSSGRVAQPRLMRMRKGLLVRQRPPEARSDDLELIWRQR
jgi:hypothetical protein